MQQRLTILGATGSVGVSTLDVVARHRDKFTVHALTANSNWSRLASQCKEFSASYAVIRQPEHLPELQDQLAKLGCTTQALAGDSALTEVAASSNTDVVMAAIVGGAGLPATMAAVSAGKKVLLANKESLVMAGEVFMQAVRDNGATLLPIDSEHNAIFQCLANGSTTHAGGVKRLLLTGSGGPLLRTPVNELQNVSPEVACAHPNWEMGRKISVDSATMMNKGLELIEACWLFDVDPDEIEIVLHPQSIVHSMVEYIDGSVIAQLGNPDMRLPIAHALAWPERIESGSEALNFSKLGHFAFEHPDLNRYPCLRLCETVARQPQCMAIALNAANEIAVQNFLDELIAFTDIPIVIETVLAQTSAAQAPTIEQILALDGEARDRARLAVSGLVSKQR